MKKKDELDRNCWRFFLSFMDKSLVIQSSYEKERKYLCFFYSCLKNKLIFFFSNLNEKVGGLADLAVRPLDL